METQLATVPAAEVAAPKLPDLLPSAAPIAGGQRPNVIVAERGGIHLTTMDEVARFSKAALLSGLAPKAFDTMEKIFIAVQMGMELGLPPMAALQNIAVIQGRPSLWGDAVPGICEASGFMESYKDEYFGTKGADDYGCRVTVRRKGRADPIVRAFSIADAKRAGLWNKAGPWSQMPDRMLLMRARTFAMRDAFPDVMRGMLTQEEARDTEPRNVTQSLAQIDAPKPT